MTDSTTSSPSRRPDIWKVGVVVLQVATVVLLAAIVMKESPQPPEPSVCRAPNGDTAPCDQAIYRAMDSLAVQPELCRTPDGFGAQEPCGQAILDAIADLPGRTEELCQGLFGSQPCGQLILDAIRDLR